MRIHGFDEPNLLASPPALDLLFAGDCGIGINEALVENQSREVVATGESWHEFVFVLKHTTRQVSGNACVQNVRTLPVRHDVNMEALRLSHDCLLVGASFRDCASTRMRHPEARRFLQPSEGSRAQHICTLRDALSVTNEHQGLWEI